MIIKLMWYFFSLLTILLILLSAPKSGSAGLSTGQNRVVNFNTSQNLVQKIISFSVTVFFSTYFLVSFEINKIYIFYYVYYKK